MILQLPVKGRIGVLEDVLYFVLEEKYNIFQCCVFLDVHLTVVTETVTTIRAVQDSSTNKYWCDCHDNKKVKSIQTKFRNGWIRKISLGS
jgi:hypothetical protein